MGYTVTRVAWLHKCMSRCEVSHVTMQPCNLVTNLFLPLAPDDLQHGVGVGRLLQGLAKFGFVEELGDIGQGVKVLLKLTLRHEEEHDQLDRLIVQGIEVDACLRAAQGADYFADQVGPSM